MFKALYQINFVSNKYKTVKSAYYSIFMTWPGWSSGFDGEYIIPEVAGSSPLTALWFVWPANPDAQAGHYQKWYCQHCYVDGT